MSFDGASDHGSWVDGVRKKTREEEERHTVQREIHAGSGQKAGMGRKSRRKRCQSRPRTRSKGSKSLIEIFMFITQVEPSQGRAKTPEAADPEDLMLEAKTQSKDNNNFSCPAQKVDERGKLEKVSVGDIERAAIRHHVTRTMTESKKPRSGLEKSCAYANNADENVMLTRQ
jgi:hypothetical protein